MKRRYSTLSGKRCYITGNRVFWRSTEKSLSCWCSVQVAELRLYYHSGSQITCLTVADTTNYWVMALVSRNQYIRLLSDEWVVLYIKDACKREESYSDNWSVLCCQRTIYNLGFLGLVLLSCMTVDTFLYSAGKHCLSMFITMWYIAYSACKKQWYRQTSFMWPQVMPKVVKIKLQWGIKLCHPPKLVSNVLNRQWVTYTL